MKAKRTNPLFARFFRGNTITTAVVISLAGLASQPAARAGTLYWDTNGATAGSGSGSADWDTGFNWTTAAAGDIPQVAWTDGETAVFSAGTDGLSFTATVTGTVTTPSIVIEEAGNTVTLAGGSINIGGGSIDSSVLGVGTNQNVAISASLTGSGGITIASHGDLSAGGGSSNSELDLTGNNTFTGDLTITSGLVGWNADAAFGDNPGDKVVLDGGGLVDTNRALTLTRDLEVTSNGGTFRVYGSANSILSGDLEGSGTLNKTDGGGLTIASNTSFTGTINSNGGSVRIADGGSLLNVAAINVNGGQLWIRRTGTENVSSFLAPVVNLTGSGSQIEFNPTNAAAALTLDQDLGSDPTLGTLRVSGGSLTLASGTDVVVNTFSLGLQSNANRGVLNVGPGSTLTTRFMDLGASGNNSGTINQTGGAVTVAAGGNGFRLGHWSSGTNDGNVYNLSGGVLDATATSGSGGVVNVGWDGKADMVVGGGVGAATLKAKGVLIDANGNTGAYNDTLTLSPNGVMEIGSSGIASASSDDRFFLNGGQILATASFNISAATTANDATSSTIDIDGFSVGFTNSLLAGTGTVNIADSFGGGVLELTTNGSQTIEAALGGSANIEKYGTGTTTLSATNPHSGDIGVMAGTLNLTGSVAGNVTVSDSTTLSGEGSIGGDLDLDSFTDANLRIDPTTPQALSAGGTVTLTGTTNVILETVPSGIDPVVTVLEYGTLSGNPATALTLPGSGSYRSATFADDAGNSRVTLTIDNEALTWTGGTDGNWDLNSTTNWLNGGANEFFYGDLVTFAEGGANPDITLVGELQPGAMAVTSDTTNYSLTGTVSDFISGLGSLLKDGASTLTIDAPNTFSGGTVISEGTIFIRQAGALGTGTVTLGDPNTGSANVALYIDTNRVSFGNEVLISSDGTGTATIGTQASVGGTGDNNQFTNIVLERDVVLDSNAADRTDYENITGTGNVTVTGTGRSIFPTSPALWTGDLTVSTTGGLQVGVASTAGDRIPDLSDVTVTAGGLLRLSTTAETIGGLNGAGTVNANAPSGGTATLTVGSGDATGSFSGLLANVGGTVALTKVGAGTQTLTGVNTHTGKTTVTGGTLAINGEDALGTAPGAATADQLLLNGGTVAAIGSFAIDDANRGITTTSPGGFFQVAAGETLDVSSPIVGAGTIAKTGDGLMTSTGGSWTGATTVSAGTLRMLSKSGTSDYVVQAGATLELAYTTGQNYNSGVVVHGSGVSATTGLHLLGGRSMNFQRNGGLRLSTAPTTIRTYGGGTSILQGFDINGTHLTVDAAASGSVIASDVRLDTGSFGYRMNVAAGAATATGDLLIDGPMTGGGSVARAGFQVNFMKYGAGSAILSGASTFPEGIWVREGTVVLNGDNLLAASAGLAFGDGATSGTVVLAGDQTVSDIGNHNSNTGSRVVGGAASVSTLTVNYGGAGRTFTGSVGGAGTNEANLAFVKSGAGTFTLAGPLAYNGSTTVGDGTLVLNTAELADASNVSIDEFGVLNLAHGASDTVNALFIEGVQVAAGTYGASGSGAANIDNTHFAGSGVLNVTSSPAAGYADWASVNAPGQTADQDYDLDGVSNGVEWVLGGDKDTNDAGKLPTASTTATDLIFTFVRDQASKTADTTVEIEVGTTLAGWPVVYTVGDDTGSSTAGVTVTDNFDGTDTVTLTVTKAPDTEKFARLKVTID
ncbi:MAG: autotransporter-associated beta strand repeat-containing protein [Akkermansiaceae bacterium]|nr:autotransporter-associated beta strand repeat-containing protein [Akkermansiaceae bacterium]MCP5545220.1 autotransporter-associated beta strand repeat-containing protein [Akkermansiaceae bacterium]